MSKDVGFIGLGNMGGRMAARLVAAGHRVVGYDPVPEAAAKIGAEPARSAGEVAERTEVVLLSLPDSKVIEPVVAEILGSAKEGTVIIDLSTASPASTQRLSAAAAEQGLTYLDAGISGGAAAAEAGTLTIMAGGDADTLASLAWVFEPIATKVEHLGASGAGHVAKVLNNFLNAVALAATAEVMVAGKKAGLDLTQLLDVLNASSGVNFATLKRFPHIVKGDYLEGGLTSRLMTKDVVLYQDLLADLGVPGLNVSGPLASFALAESLGYGGQISNRVVDAIGDVAGRVRLFDPTED
jgi:3-hydroxyisobutyrate dehydrogenase